MPQAIRHRQPAGKAAAHPSIAACAPASGLFYVAPLPHRRSNRYGVTPKRMARSAGVISVGFRSNRMQASCNARAISETQP